MLQHYWKLKRWSSLSYKQYYYWILLLSLENLPVCNIWWKSADDKLTTSILFLLLENCLMTSSIFKDGLRMILFSLTSSDIFSFVGFLVCFFLKIVTIVAELSSDEAVDGLSGNDGVEVDWVVKDMSVQVGGKDVGGVTVPILRVGRPFEVNREFRTVSNMRRFLTVFDSGNKDTDYCIWNTALFESWNMLNWNSDVVWSGISFNWGHWWRVAMTIAMCKHLRIW